MSLLRDLFGHVGRTVTAYAGDKALMLAAVSAAANVIVADTDEEARRLFTSVQMRFVGMVRNERGLLAPPIDDIEAYWTPTEKLHASRMLTCSFVGSPATVERELRAFVARTGIDEHRLPIGQFKHAGIPLADIQKRHAKDVSVRPAARRPTPPDENEHHAKNTTPPPPLAIRCNHRKTNRNKQRVIHRH